MRVILHEEDKRIRSKFEAFVVPLHKFLFSLICFHLPFNYVEGSVFNHLLSAPSKLHPVGSVYIKVFQYWCEYKKDVSTTPFFLHLFKAHITPLTRLGSRYDIS